MHRCTVILKLHAKNLVSLHNNIVWLAIRTKPDQTANKPWVVWAIFSNETQKKYPNHHAVYYISIFHSVLITTKSLIFFFFFCQIIIIMFHWQKLLNTIRISLPLTSKFTFCFRVIIYFVLSLWYFYFPRNLLYPPSKLKILILVSIVYVWYYVSFLLFQKKSTICRLRSITENLTLF